MESAACCRASAFDRRGASAATASSPHLASRGRPRQRPWNCCISSAVLADSTFHWLTIDAGLPATNSAHGQADQALAGRDAAAGRFARGEHDELRAQVERHQLPRLQQSVILRR